MEHDIFFSITDAPGLKDTKIKDKLRSAGSVANIFAFFLVDRGLTEEHLKQLAEVMCNRNNSSAGIISVSRTDTKCSLEVKTTTC